MPIRLRARDAHSSVRATASRLSATIADSVFDDPALAELESGHYVLTNHGRESCRSKYRDAVRVIVGDVRHVRLSVDCDRIG